MTLDGLLDHDGVAIEQGDARWSYQDLRDRVAARVLDWSGHALTQRSIRITDVSVIEQIVSVLACARLGAIFTLSDSPAVSVDFESQLSQIIPTDDGMQYRETVGALFVTSGTSANERVVGHRLSSLQYCAEDMILALDLGPRTRSALLLPMSFHYGFSIMSSTLLAGGTLLLPLSPTDWFTLPIFFEQAKPSLVASVPHFWRVLLRLLPASTWEYFHTAVLAGDDCPTDLLEAMQDCHAEMQLHIFYGSTEVLRTSHHRWRRGDPDGIIGHPLPSSRLQLSNIGTIQTGRTLFEHLVEAGETIDESPSEWLLSDDLVQLSDGTWQFVSRSDDVLKIGGVRVAPQTIEAFFLQASGLIDVVVGQTPMGLMAVIQNDNHQDLRHICVSLPSRFTPKQWIVLEEPFPVTQRQKRSRQRIIAYATANYRAAQKTPFRLVATND